MSYGSRQMLRTPAEIDFLGIYLPPIFTVCLLGFLSALAVAQLLNWSGASRFFWHPPLAFVATWVLASSMIGLWLIAP